jgi:threonine-phosphate decarboxylase
MRPSRRPIHGGNIRAAGEAAGRPILDFSACTNPLSFPAGAAVSRAARELDHYPDDRYVEFREAAARFCGAPPGLVVPGNGSTELIDLAIHALLQPGDRVVVRGPTYEEYRFRAALAGAEVKEGSGPDSSRMVFLCNPNNPTGELLPRDELLRLAEECDRRRAVLVVDESFVELSDPGQTVAPDVADFAGLLVLRSLSKAFGLPGLRAGFAAASPPVAEALEARRSPWSLSVPAEAVAQACFRRAGPFLERSRRLVARERTRLMEGLREAGLRPRPSEAPFFCADAPVAASRAAREFLKRGFLVRDCASFGLPRTLRFGIRTPAANRRLLEAARSVLS